MALISMRQLLDHAAEHGYGVPAFNVNNLEQMRAIMEAADQTNSPVIVQASAGARRRSRGSSAKQAASGSGGGGRGTKQACASASGGRCAEHAGYSSGSGCAVGVDRPRPRRVCDPGVARHAVGGARDTAAHCMPAHTERRATQ